MSANPASLPFSSASSSSSSSPHFQPSCVKCRPILSGCENGPHALNPFKRYYIGPLPVPSSSAFAVAKAIVEDSGCHLSQTEQQQQLGHDRLQQHSDSHSLNIELPTQSENDLISLRAKKSASPVQFWKTPFLRKQSSSEQTLTKAATLGRHHQPGRVRPAILRDASTTSFASAISFFSAQSVTPSAITGTDVAEPVSATLDPRPSTPQSPPLTNAQDKPILSSSPSQPSFAMYRKQTLYPGRIQRAASEQSHRTASFSSRFPALFQDSLYDQNDRPALANSPDIVGAAPTKRRLGDRLESPSSASDIFSSLLLPLLDLPVAEADETNASPQDETQLKRVFDSSLSSSPIRPDHLGSSSLRQPEYSNASDSDPTGSRARAHQSSVKKKRRGLSPSMFSHSGHVVESSNHTIIDWAQKDLDHAQDVSTNQNPLSARPDSSFQAATTPESSWGQKSAYELRKYALQHQIQHHDMLNNGRTSPVDNNQLDPSYTAMKPSVAQRLTTQTVQPDANRVPSSPSSSVPPPHVSLSPSSDHFHQVNIPNAQPNTSQNLAQRIKEKARSKLAQNKLDHKDSLALDTQADTHSPFPQLHASHRQIRARQASRASRMSRASTAGTFNTVGSAIADGSFGATGGVRDKIARSLFTSNSLKRDRNARVNYIRAANSSDNATIASQTARRYSSAFMVKSRPQRKQRQSSYGGLAPRRTVDREISVDSAITGSSSRRHSRWSSYAGVVPGAVGTSAGGTKWVGQSFEIGKRFWDILEARRANLVQSSPCFHHVQPSALDPQNFDEQNASGEKGPKAKHSNLGQEPANDKDSMPTSQYGMTKSPSGVLSLMTEEAYNTAMEKELKLVPLKQEPEQKQNHLEPVDQTVKRFQERDASSVQGFSPASLAAHPKIQPNDYLLHPDLPKPEVGHLIEGDKPNGRQRIVSMDSSTASIISVPQGTHSHRGFSDIESRKGWQDIVTMMSAHTAVLVGQAPAARLGNNADRTNRQVSDQLIETHDPASVYLTSQRNGPRGPPTGKDAIGKDYSSGISRTQASINESLPERPTSSRYVDASQAMPTTREQNNSNPNQHDLDIPRKLTRKDIWNYPEPPISVDDKFPELTHELLRRRSDEFEEPVIKDSASDHAVIIQAGVTPKNTSPAHEIDLLANGHSADPALVENQTGFTSAMPTSSGIHASSIVDTSVQNFPNRNTQALLSPNPVSSNEHQTLAPVSLSVSALKDPLNTNSSLRKKTVSFQPSSLTANKNPTRNSLTSTLFARPSDDLDLDVKRKSAQEDKPASPEEVLARPQKDTLTSLYPEGQIAKHEKHPTYIGGSSPYSESIRWLKEEPITRKTILKKDRMLVRFAWTPHEDLPKDFDELSSRKFPIREEKWREFIVVFRMGKLEFWSDPSFTSRVVGHGDRLKLKHTIPLARGSTFLSVFSPIDRIFCLTYQPWKNVVSHSNRRGLHLRRHGTEIVLFNCRARTVAVDWMWELWRELGGLIPETIEVHMPALGLKVKIPIPDEMPVEKSQGEPGLASIGDSQQGGEGFKVISRTKIVSLCWNLVSAIPEWTEVLELSERMGVRIELAWRKGVELDWILHERTAENRPRPWAVLCGSVLREYRNPSVLEIRAASHYPTNVQLGSGKIMQEPPAVEGYVWRVKPVSGALTRIYITSHDGLLFACRNSRAFAPDRHLAVQLQNVLNMRVPRTSGNPAAPPATGAAKKSTTARAIDRFLGREKALRREEDMATLRQQVLEAISYQAETEEEMQAQIDAYRAFERRRQFEQIRGSDGFIDLRSIYMIKAVGKGPVRCPGKDEAKPSGPMGGAAALRRVNNDLDAAPREDEESETEGVDDGKDTGSKGSKKNKSGQEEEEEEEEDLGGEEGLALAADRNELRKSRQVEVILDNGKSIRIEMFSKSIAREWIEKLSELAKYWRRRERIDAMEMMNASGIDKAAFIKRLKATSGLPSNGKTTAEPFSAHVNTNYNDQVAMALGNLWHWCMVEGCRGIIRSGRLFHKKSSYGPFSGRHYVLIGGRLICFKLVTSLQSARARQNAGLFHKRQETVIHLRDAYVYSGKLSEEMLANGRSAAAQAVDGVGGGGSSPGERHRIPRVYADGLFSVDEDEDCTFVIRYRPQRVNHPDDPENSNVALKATIPEIPQPQQEPSNPPPSPSLSNENEQVHKLDDKTYNVIALRTRSKIERDLWVRAITYEIERSVRNDIVREDRLKNCGKVE